MSRTPRQWYIVHTYSKFRREVDDAIREQANRCWLSQYFD